jgi:hypothetical protein
MNERIQQLAHEAGLPTYNPEGSPTKLEKFAELIVKECMKVARGADGLDATHEAWYLIQEHFGLGLSTEDKKTLIKELLGVKE